MAVPSDREYTNFTVDRVLVCRGTTVTTNAKVRNLTIVDETSLAGDVLMNVGDGLARWSKMPFNSATINCGVNPNGMAITADGKTAYVANSNNYTTVAGNYISVIDLEKNVLKTNIVDASFVQPYTATLSPDGTKVYISNSASPLTDLDEGTLSIVDVASNTVTGTITGFDGPSGLVIVPSTNIGYVNNYGAAGGVSSGNGTTISVVNLNTNTITGTITLSPNPAAPAALALSPDYTKLYVACYTDGTDGAGNVVIISTSTNLVTTTINGFFGPFALALDYKYLYVTNFGSNNFDPFGTQVSVIDVQTNALVTAITTGIQPSGVAIVGNYVYVSNYNTLYQVQSPSFTGLTAGQGTMSIIDSNSLEVVATVDTGLSPSNIFPSLDGNYVYVTNYTGNTVTVIKTL